MDTFKSMTKKVWETMSWGKIITFCRHNFSKQNSEIELNRAQEMELQEFGNKINWL